MVINHFSKIINLGHRLPHQEGGHAFYKLFLGLYVRKHNTQTMAREKKHQIFVTFGPAENNDYLKVEQV